MSDLHLDLRQQVHAACKRADLEKTDNDGLCASLLSGVDNLLVTLCRQWAYEEDLSARSVSSEYLLVA